MTARARRVMLLGIADYGWQLGDSVTMQSHDAIVARYEVDYT